MTTTRCAWLCALCLLVACSKKDGSKDKKSPTPATAGTSKPATEPGADKPTAAPTPGDKTGDTAAKKSDHGDFRPVYGDTDNAELDEAFREAKLLEELTAGLNEVLALPRDVAVKLEDCDEPNAYYSNEDHSIVVCYQLIEMFEAGFDRRLDADDEVIDATLNATLFTFFHELGHALVHELDLPVTGKEEDAVDQLATLVLLQEGADGATTALDGAESFLLHADESGVDDLPFWGEHSLDEQRFYNIVCLVYGSDPDKHEGLVESDALPEERAEICPAEYQQISRAWSKLLDPHFL